MSANSIVIVSAKRTAIGNFNGCFKNLPASDLGKECIKAVIEDSAIDKAKISEVIIGQVLTTLAGQNPARQASINAGLAEEVPALTINQVCGSGLRSVALASAIINSNPDSIIIAGGQENMTLAPHAARLRQGLKMGDGNLQDSMIYDGLWDAFNDYHMGITAENIAEKYSISRQEQDSFACNSQNKAKEAQKKNLFKDEIAPVKVVERRQETTIEVDEFPRHDCTEESLSLLKPVFKKDGTVTAGNASGINDGSAMLLVMSEKQAETLKLKPLARIASFAQSGVSPEIMGIGPVSASKEALKIAGWAAKDLDVIEANEAFAAQAISVNKEMDWDINNVNITGGAIALGHPIGASGARILTTLIHNMKRTNAKKGLATLCVGGGMGVAICLEGN